MPLQTIFAACAPGLEPVLAWELSALGLEARPLAGGVEASGEDAVAIACIGARTADGVVLRLYDGPARHLDAAVREARRRAGTAALAIRREGGCATISLDAVGEPPLFKRGWRARIGAAPLRESVAAGMLLFARWDGAVPLVDPMCGSGTIAIEGALLATRRAPGRGRTFAFEAWPWHDPARTAAVRARLAALERTVPPARVAASDRNGGALHIAARNAQAAGVADVVLLERADVEARTLPPGPGLIAVNPPFGIRLDREVSASWAALRSLLGRSHGWRAVVLGPAVLVDGLLERRAVAALSVLNGGIRCRIVLLET